MTQRRNVEAGEFIFLLSANQDFFIETQKLIFSLIAPQIEMSLEYH